MTNVFASIKTTRLNVISPYINNGTSKINIPTIPTGEDELLLKNVEQIVSGKTITSASNNLDVDVSDISGVLPISKGGTGATEFTQDHLVLGDSASLYTSNLSINDVATKHYVDQHIANGNTYYDCIIPDDYRNINEAVESGAKTIYVRIGTWLSTADTIPLNNIYITGKSKEESVLDIAQYKLHAYNVTNCTIENSPDFKIHSASDIFSVNCKVVIADAADSKFIDNHLFGGSINIKNSARCIFTGNNLYSCSPHGLTIDADSPGCIVTNNIFANSVGYGCVLNADNIVFQLNKFVGNGIGPYIDNGLTENEPLLGNLDTRNNGVLEIATNNASTILVGAPLQINETQDPQLQIPALYNSGGDLWWGQQNLSSPISTYSTSPPSGIMYYNTTLGEIMVFDNIRNKWLSSARNIAFSSAVTREGGFYNTNGVISGASNGFIVPVGTLVRISISTYMSGVHVLQVLVSGVVVAEIEIGSAHYIADMDADFPAGIMTFRCSKGTSINAHINICYKLRNT